MSVRPSAHPSNAPPAYGTRIELCGSLRVEIDGRDVTAALPGRQGRSLFAFLVANRRRPVARHELHDVLWPQALPDAPDTGLSTVLARLRRAVGEGVIEGRSELVLRLEDDAEVDVEHATAGAQEAEGALAQGDPEAAVAAAEAALEIVSRPLLPGLEGRWIDDLQNELSELEPGLLEVLARAGLALGGDRLAGAERAAARLVERHPFREAGHALLIEAQAARGNLAEATRTYHRLRELLRDELGTAPSPDVSALHEALLRRADTGAPAERPGPAGGRVPLPPIGGAQQRMRFVGREPQLEQLRSAWQETADGEYRLAVAVGEAGMGKSRLAAHFAREVHEGGGTVLYGRCDEEPLLAYQPFVEALRHYLRHGDWRDEAGIRGELLELSRLVPEARVEPAGETPPQRDPEGGRIFLFEAVATLLRHATGRRPLLLVLDDLHWADRPTLLLLRHLLRQVDPIRLMVLGLFRDVDVGTDHPLAGLVADLRRECRFERIELSGFDERESEALVGDYLAAPATEGFVRGLHGRTEGNPFFLQEALRSLIETDAVEPGEAASEQALQSVGVPESVADVILRRVGRVSELTSEALTVAAVIGREFDARTTAAVLDTDEDAVIGAMEEAMSAGLVVEVPSAIDRFTFCHALVREAIYDRVSTSRRLRLHRRVAEALEAGSGAVEAELAHHFFLARQVGGAEKAVHYGMRAAEAAVGALAYEEAAGHYRRALEALDCTGERDEALRCDVLLALGRVQWRAGDAAARETYFEAADGARRRGAAEQLARAALGLGERYWEAKAVDVQYRELLAEALDGLPDEDSVLRARLMARLAENLHFTAELEYGAELSRETVEMARRLGEPGTLVTALMGRHVALLHIEHLDERVRLIEEVLSLTDSDRGLFAEALHWLLFDLCELGDVPAAVSRHAELAALATQLKQPLLQHLAIGWEFVFAQLAGEVEEAEALAMDAFDFGRRAQIGDAGSTLAGMLYVVRRQQGRLGELVPAMESVVAGMPSAGLTWDAAMALAQLEVGNVERGRELFDHFAASDFAEVPRDWYWFITIALLAEACVALGDVERAHRLYELLAPFADRSVQVLFLVCFGSVQRQLGMLAGVMDRFEEADAHFCAALESNEQMGALLMAAETRCAHAALLLRRAGEGDAERASALAAPVAELAAARGLEGLRRQAEALTEGR